MTYEEWKKEVDSLCRKRTGCTWNDLCGDDWVLEGAFEEGDTPNDFVTDMIEQFGLTEIPT